MNEYHLLKLRSPFDHALRRTQDATQDMSHQGLARALGFSARRHWNPGTMRVPSPVIVLTGACPEHALSLIEGRSRRRGLGRGQGIGQSRAGLR